MGSPVFVLYIRVRFTTHDRGSTFANRFAPLNTRVPPTRNASVSLRNKVRRDAACCPLTTLYIVEASSVMGASGASVLGMTYSVPDEAELHRMVARGGAK